MSTRRRGDLHRSGRGAQELPEPARGHQRGDDHRLRRDPSRLRLPQRGRDVRGGLRGARPDVHRSAARGARAVREQVRRAPDARRQRSADRARAAAASSPTCATRWSRRREAGYPVLLKPSAGGGGRGMRLVRSPREMETSLPLARSEAQAAFGDDSVYFEKWIEESRHVEVQVMVDRHGNGVHLGERDCSVQRRHQKIIEEGPSPAMDDAARDRLRDLAIRSVDRGGIRERRDARVPARRATATSTSSRSTAGSRSSTPSPRLLTGLDLIAEQIRIAAGEPLSLRQERGRVPRPRNRVPHQRGGSRRQLRAADGRDRVAPPARRARASGSTRTCTPATRCRRSTTACSPS